MNKFKVGDLVTEKSQSHGIPAKIVEIIDTGYGAPICYKIEFQEGNQIKKATLPGHRFISIKDFKEEL